MATKFHATAERSGAKIVLGGGVDSIPSDLGCMLAVDALLARGGLPDGEPIQVQGVYTEYTGSFSGGTLNSGRAMRKALEIGRASCRERV